MFLSKFSPVNEFYLRSKHFGNTLLLLLFSLRNALMFNNEQMADAHFIVGPPGETQKVPAHKVSALGLTLSSDLIFSGPLYLLPVVWLVPCLGVSVRPGGGQLRVWSHVLRRSGWGSIWDPHPWRGAGRFPHSVEVSLVWRRIHVSTSLSSERWRNSTMVVPQLALWVVTKSPDLLSSPISCEDRLIYFTVPRSGVTRPFQCSLERTQGSSRQSQRSWMLVPGVTKWNREPWGSFRVLDVLPVLKEVLDITFFG